MDVERQLIVNELLMDRSQILMTKNLKSELKSSERSQELRKKGNQLYVKVGSNALQNEETFKLYSQSIRFAECDSEDLALAYGNRSALLFRMKKYKESISDIEKALKISKTDEYKIKLLCRKIECLAIEDSESKDTYSEVEHLMSKIDNENTSKRSLNEMVEKTKVSLKKVTKANDPKEDVIPEHIKILSQKEKVNPFNNITIKENRKYGRYLVANRDFKPGEIINVEKPYVKILNLINAHIFCGHCLVISWATIPCDYCNWCMFCSENCKKEAWKKYHDIECTIVAQVLMIYDSIIKFQLLSIRSLIMGIREAGGNNQLETELQAVDKNLECTRGFQNNGTLASTGLKTIYTLNDDINKVHLEKYTTSSVFILISLIKYTTLFEKPLKGSDIKSLVENEDFKDALFIGSLILKLHKISDKNCQQLPGEDPHTCKYGHDIAKCHTISCCSRGSCILPINSLINHNCDPNVKNVIATRSQRFIVYSLVPIKKNSQIFICYHLPFFEMPRPKRQHLLKYGFNFICDCAACEENWPVISDLIDVVQKNPKAFSPKDLEFLYIEDETVRPIIENYEKVKCNQKTINIISEALIKTTRHVKQPSISLWKLKRCLQGAFEKLYENC